jgi:hypothetical protein
MMSWESRAVSVHPRGINVVGVVGRVVVVDVVVEEVEEDGEDVRRVVVVALPDGEEPQPAITATAAIAAHAKGRDLLRRVTNAPWGGRYSHPGGSSRCHPGPGRTSRLAARDVLQALLAGRDERHHRTELLADLLDGVIRSLAPQLFEFRAS